MEIKIKKRLSFKMIALIFFIFIYVITLSILVKSILNGLVIVDDTDTNFSQGTFHMTNMTGIGAGANVTLNYTTNYQINVTYPVYNITGNFTSKAFDTGQNHTVFDKIAWTSLLPNTSDVMGYSMDTSGGSKDTGVFYRNGSIGTNLNVRSYDQNITYTDSLIAYTIPSGWKYEDILGFGWDDDGSPNLFAFFRNGSVAISAGQAGLTADVSFSTTGSYTIPANFNHSDILGFAVDGGSTTAAVFFKNRSFAVAATETAPFTFTTVRAFTLLAGFNTSEVIGTDASDFGGDVAMFFRNGSYVSDVSQANFGTNIDFASVFATSYFSGLNLTETTNITLQTRVSNDTSTIWTDWSSVYINPNGAQTIEGGNGRYIQYKAVFTTSDKYFTPILENVSINYTIDIIRPEVNSSINNTAPKIGEIINFTANISDTSGLSFCQFIDNMSLDGSKRFFNTSISGKNDKCSQNYTISLPKKSVINFTLLVNDTYGNINRTEFAITLVNWIANLTNIAILSPINLNVGNTTFIECNATVADNDNISDIKSVNATFYQPSIGSDAPNDNNNRYTNLSCFAFANSTFESNYTCGFNLLYYANNGTWECSIAPVDNDDAIASGNISAVISELMAIDVSPSIIDYGTLKAVISADVNVTMKNFGNIPINVTLRGFAPNESLAYLNLSMACEEGNISNTNHRFSITNGSNFLEMTSLNNETLPIQNITLQQRTDDVIFGNDTNSTFWKLQVPALTFGICNGTIIFSAIDLT